MSRHAEIIAEMRRNPAGIRFAEAVKVAEDAFGPPRQSGSSHLVFRTPWPMDPRVNLQKGENGKAKPYQIKQLLLALDKLAALKQAAPKGEGP